MKTMLYLKILDNKGNAKLTKRGSNINFTYDGVWEIGDKIKVLLDGCNYISVKLDDTLKESIVYVMFSFSSSFIETSDKLSDKSSVWEVEQFNKE